MIDDASVDDTVAIVQSYQNKFSYLTVLHQEHGGPGRARNW
jgi:glycosyltransferase involved in cell wall biosynthesis